MTIRVSAYNKPLFAGDSLRGALAEQLTNGERAVASLTPEQVLAVDPAAWLDEYMARVRTPRLGLQFDQAHVEPKGAEYPPLLVIPITGATELVILDPERDPKATVHQRAARP